MGRFLLKLSERDFSEWLDTFIEEKGIDREATFEFDLDGEWNHMMYGIVIDAAKGASPPEQAQIKDTIVKIDFRNGDVKHFLRYLGEGLAKARQSRQGEGDVQ